MKVLSCDPAIKNLAICKMDINDKKLSDLEMNLFDLCRGQKVKTYAFGDLMDSLFETLDTIDTDDVQLILIENIPSYKNPTIKTISIAIYSYFCLKGLNVIFVSPNCKPKEIKQCKKYSERKKMSVKLCMDILDDDSRDKLRQYKKADDIADCIIQALHYCTR